MINTMNNEMGDALMFNGNEEFSFAFLDSKYKIDIVKKNNLLFAFQKNFENIGYYKST